jgi:1-acyl-sn-glycerol-3-phosphate acyltransferase
VKLPPRWLRRIVLWPLPLLAFILYITTVPLFVIAALVVSYRLPGKWRALRLLGLATCYLFVEVAVTISALAMWLASGFGWKLSSEAFVSAHYRLLRWTLRLLVYTGSRLFSLSIEQDGTALPTDSGDGTTSDAPLIVLSRHAGPADSFLLLHEVMSWAGRRPRIVAKATLQLDPVFDILLNRLPNRFIETNPAPGSDAVSAIAELATGMTNRDAFVIFPEGGNFTEGRRVRAIERLRSDGHDEAARRAESMTHVLAPRPAGTLAAIGACPDDADVVLVAHTGLDEIFTVPDLWASLPEDKTLHLAWRVLPAAEVPTGSAERIDLLFRAWEGIDKWIGDHRATE